MRRPPKILNTLLHIRELREERARERLSAALSALENARRDLDEVRKSQQAIYEELTGKILSGRDLQLFGEGLEVTYQETARLEEKLKARISEAENLKKELEKAYLEKKVIERFKERLWERYRWEEERAFYQELDDLILMRRANR